MLPSIKESDRYTDDERMCLAVSGFVITIFAAALNVAIYLSGYITSFGLMLIFLGPVMMGMSCCATYKGNIRLVDVAGTLNMACPECGTQGMMEGYDKKLGQKTERKYRVIYTERKTTVYWAKMIFCRSCGHKDDRGGHGTLQQGNDLDPLSKAKAILAASKAKPHGNIVATGKVVYEKLPLEEGGVSSTTLEMTDQASPSRDNLMLV